MWIPIGLIAAVAAAATPPAEETLRWRGQTARAVATAGGHRLRTPTAEHAIAAGRLRSDTASPMFDALFALAQAELEQAKVAAIRDGAFARGEAIACECFETGEKWPYVWTRDLAYAADLALARLEPARTRNALRFKLGAVRAPGVPAATVVAQDTGSGGSWPVSTDRVAWFLAAEHLLDDPAFAEEVWRALSATLAHDRAYAFDPELGLYRGETSFLDWREQSYPVWTRDEVTFVAESFALSTNVLHYRALRLGERLARARRDPRAGEYRRQAEALARAIDARFWREERGLYMSYIGPAAHPVPFEAYDLLGIALAVTSGIAPPERARRALTNYPRSEAGSPVIWPQQPGVPIYHNRAIWPFVSAYALRAARAIDDPARIAHEVRSLMRGAALAGSHMENYELVTQATHVRDGALSGPVVNSRRQLWSLAGYLDMVVHGVFGLQPDGRIAPKLPRELVPMLFGEREQIALELPGRRVVLLRPDSGDGELLVAGAVEVRGSEIRVRLVPKVVPEAAAPAFDAAAFAPPAPDAAPAIDDGQPVEVGPGLRLYVDGRRIEARTFTPAPGAPHCLSFTRVDARGLESLHGPIRCTGEQTLAGAPPYRWTAPAAGRYRVRLRYANPHGPINTGITAAVKRWRVACDGRAVQRGPVVMPHSVRVQASTAWTFAADAGAVCTFSLDDGINMSYLDHFARYTGGAGGEAGPLNAADIEGLSIAPVPGEHDE
ncbi:MAG TPA: Six-hairpin glycosidase-like protein [Lysobacter sp.]|nr:Six-hairpin glycosidase-like protein [Lysobacter sp.]